MKAISLWQPYASLIALGLKTYETRSWPTSYRGLIAIHAAKARDSLHMCGYEPFCTDLENAGCTSPTNLPLGAVVAVAQLVQVHRTESLRDILSVREQAYGDYSAGRYAWQLKNVYPLPQPIPARGEQGIWEWTPPEGFPLS